MTNRPNNQLRTLAITPHYLMHPAGSVLVEFGNTKVICAASIEENLPRWLKGQGKGWVTAEYDMLPSSTSGRKRRDSQRGKVNGRTQEISRLIGRSLRTIVNLETLGEQSITVDCDVIQADGGTRTAAITGAFVALHLALQTINKTEALDDHIAAVSVGLIDEKPYLDLDYALDVKADVDMNVMMTGSGRLAEVQGAGEEATFSRQECNTLLDLAFDALPTLIDLQKQAIACSTKERLTIEP